MCWYSYHFYKNVAYGNYYIILFIYIIFFKIYIKIKKTIILKKWIRILIKNKIGKNNRKEVTKP